MSKKPYHYAELSHILCSKKNCSRPIKLNVVKRLGERSDLLCYKHYSEMQRKRSNKRVPANKLKDQRSNKNVIKRSS